MANSDRRNLERFAAAVCIAKTDEWLDLVANVEATSPEGQAAIDSVRAAAQKLRATAQRVLDK